MYALGVLLYELLDRLAAVRPDGRCEKAGLLEMLRVVREEEPPTADAPSSVRGGCPAEHLGQPRHRAEPSSRRSLRGELDWIVMKALEKDRARRYETANGLARDVQRYLADEVVEARPPSTGYRLRKFVRRHKGQVVAASLVLFVFMAGMAGTAFGLVRAENRRVEAEQSREGSRTTLDRQTE